MIASRARPAIAVANQARTGDASGWLRKMRGAALVRRHSAPRELGVCFFLLKEVAALQAGQS
jgi:hypothetical protein